MVKLLSIVKSKVKNKKFTATFLLDNGKTKKVNFGSAGMRDFTLISDENSKFFIEDPPARLIVKRNYIKRHMKDLRTEDNKIGIGPGALSMFVLWNKPTLKSSIQDYKRRFKL